MSKIETTQNEINTLTSSQPTELYNDTQSIQIHKIKHNSTCLQYKIINNTNLINVFDIIIGKLWVFCSIVIVSRNNREF